MCRTKRPLHTVSKRDSKRVVSVTIIVLRSCITDAPRMWVGARLLWPRGDGKEELRVKNK